MAVLATDQKMNVLCVWTRMKLGVTNSSADFYGGGIYNQGAPSSLFSTTVSGNSAYDNGDITCLSVR